MSATASSTLDAGSPSRADSAYSLLREKIVSCEIAPGSTITERGLANELGLGPTPVREALARLRFDGLVVALPRVGYQVTSMTVKDISDVFQNWSIFGPAIVRLGLPRMTDADRETLTTLVADSTSIAARPGSDIGAGLQLDEQMFQIIVQATGNARLIQIWDRLQSDLLRLFNIVVRHPDADALVVITARAAQGVLSATSPTKAAEIVTAFIADMRRTVMELVTTIPSVATANVHPMG